jgi:hypothetical protein
VPHYWFKDAKEEQLKYKTSYLGYVGLGLYSADGRSFDYELCRDFIEALRIKPRTTHNVLKLARDFLNWHATYERRAKGVENVAEIQLGKDILVSETMASFKRKYALKESTDVVDMQADCEDSMSVKDSLKLLRDAYESSSVAHRSRNVQTVANFVAMLAKALATGQRGEALRSMKFGLNFTRSRDHIGEDGMTLGVTVTNQGKTNQAGRREITGWFTNINPLLDPSANDGMMFFLRFCIIKKEIFPYQFDKTNGALFFSNIWERLCIHRPTRQA